jgi:hypothetical protein
MLDWRTLSGCNEPGLRSIGSIKMYQLFSDTYRQTRHHEGERFAGSSDKLELLPEAVGVVVSGARFWHMKILW